MVVLCGRHFTQSIKAYWSIKLSHFTTLLEKRTLKNWKKYNTTNTFQFPAATVIDISQEIFLYNHLSSTKWPICAWKLRNTVATKVWFLSAATQNIQILQSSDALTRLNHCFVTRNGSLKINLSRKSPQPQRGWNKFLWKHNNNFPIVLLVETPCVCLYSSQILSWFVYQLHVWEVHSHLKMHHQSC